MKAKCAIAVLSMALCASTALAEQDFFGVQMRDELWAFNLVQKVGPQADQNDLLQGPVIDQAVFAEALVRLSGDQTEFMLNVVNESAEAVPTEYEGRDFILYLNDGKKVPLIDVEADADKVSVAPKKSVTFMPSLGNLKLRPEQIRMIEASFDTGRTRIFLFPASKKSEIRALKNPPPPLGPVKGKKRAPGHFWEWMSGKPKASKVPSADPGGSSGRDRVDRAIRDFKYTPAPVPAPKATSAANSQALKEKAIDRALVMPSETGPVEAVRAEARVIEFNKTYNYITINLGAQDGLYSNMLLNIVRNGKLIARARVRQVREDVSAAAILPEFRKPDVRPGDLISFG